MSTFVHLHTHSAYSLAEGALKVKDLIKLCVKNDMPAVAVTDTNNMFGAMEFAIEAKNNGVQPILGAQVSVDEDGHQIVLLVQNEQGYRNLCRLISDAYMEGEPASAVCIEKDQLKRFSEGLICLSGGSKGEISNALVHGQNDKAQAALEFYHELFGDRFYIELQRHGWEDEERAEDALIDLAHDLEIPLVATNDCYFPESASYEAHDALLCISEGRYVTEEDRRKVTPEHYFKSAKEMEALFSDIPEAIQNTAIIAQRCSYLLEPIDPILPPFENEKGRNEQDELTAQSQAGLEWRLENFVYTDDMSEAKKQEIAKPYRDRLVFELAIIAQMGFPGYFLIVSDFIKWSKEQNIPVGPGRGSGAGSVVAWVLKITDLDPLALGLLFERFLNPERVSMPDFDIDFCQERRDEVIRYVQDKYGYDHVAQIITFGKLQARAVVRDVGRVLQMPYGQVDKISKMIPNNPANPMTLEEALASDEDLRRVRKQDDTTDKLITIALQLEGLYRHASTHAAGVVIGDRPLHELIPLYRDPRSDMPVTQFNMKYVEQAGLVKFDFLGLKTMTVIQKAVEMVKAKGEDIDILQIGLDDKKSYELMAKGDTVGVFQLESAGMRDTLRKVKPNRFEDIIALVSLYRPGPMDNIPKYISVKEGHEEPDYMHPKLEEFLTETYGIMIYQEQVMQAAQALSGYSLGGADLLRRAMGKKIQEEMDKQRKMFVDGASEHNKVPGEQASAIFDQIAKFAGYGFNKSHAAAYALIAYWTAWLKANHPLEFYAASMTLDLGNTDKLSVFKQDMDRMKMELYPPDINSSAVTFNVENNKGVRYALAALKGVGEQAMHDLCAERTQNGAYKSLDDFVTRLNPKIMNRRQFEQMVYAGVFDELNDNRAQVHSGVEMMLRHAQSLAEERDSGQVSLFGGGAQAQDSGMGMPALQEIKPWNPLERLGHEFGAVGFYLSAHPLDTRQGQLEKMGIKTFVDVEQELLNTPALRVQMAGVLLKKQEKMSQKGSKYAFLQLSDPSGIFEVTLFSELLFATREYLEPGTLLLLTLNAESQEDQVRFTTQRIDPLDEALEGKISQIQIKLDHRGPIKKVKEFLDIEGKGMAKIVFISNLDEQNREVKVKLPGSWSLSAQARDRIREQDGVISITEH